MGPRMPSPSKPSFVRSPSRGRRFLKWLRNGGIAGILLTVTLFVFQAPIIRRFVLPRVESELERVLGLKSTIASARIDLRGVLIVGAVNLEGEAPRSGFLGGGFDALRVHFSPWRALRGRADWIEKVSVDRARLSLHLEREPILPDLGGQAPVAQSSALIVMPPIELVDADLRVLTNVDSLRLLGVDVTLSAKGIKLLARGGEGDWRPPRVGGLKFPLEVEAEFVDEASFWSQIHLTRLAMARREYTRDFNIQVSRGGAVELSGSLPGWGVDLTKGSVANGVIDLTFRASRGDLRSIVSLFTDWPVPTARCTGDFRLVLPIGREMDWEVEADVELHDLVWPEQSTTAECVHAVVTRRAPGLVLTGGFHLRNASWRNLPALDLCGRFRRWDAGPSAGGPWIEIQDTTAHVEGAAVDFEGLLREDGLVWEGVSIRSRAFPLQALSGLELFPKSLVASDGRLDMDSCFSGSTLDPGTVVGSVSLKACGHGPGEDPVLWSLSVATRWMACVLKVDDGTFQWANDEARFRTTVSPTGTGLPVSVSFESLEGSIGGVELAAIEPPFITIDENDLFIRPTVIGALGGFASAQAALDFSGDGLAILEGNAFDLARIEKLAEQGEILRRLGLTGLASFRVLCTACWSPQGQSPALLAESSIVNAGVNIGWKRLEGLQGSARITMDRDDLNLRELKVTHGGSTIELSGQLPVEWGLFPKLAEGKPFEVRLGVDLTEVADYVPPAAGESELGGRLVANGSARGRVEAEVSALAQSFEPMVLVSLFNGRIKRLGDFPPLTEVQADLRLSGRTISIDNLSGKILDAGLAVTGETEISFPWESGGASVRSSDLRLVAKGALLVRRPELRARGDLDLRWRGPWNSPHLEGDITISRAYYRQDLSLAPSPGVRLPLKLFSLSTPPLDAITLAVRIRSNRGLNVKNNIVSTRATLDLLLGGTGHEPVLTGIVSTDEGRIRIADSSLKLRNSFVEFRRDDPLNPRLQILIGETIRGYAVTLSITGTLDSPEVLLDSSPPLEREKVLVLITTGLTLDEIGDRGVGRVAAVKAAKYVGLRVARYFSRGDPIDQGFLDRISLETESARTARQEDPIRVEYRLTESLLRENDELFLQGERDSYGDYNFNVGVRFELD